MVKKNKKDTVVFFDTTLRDGEQSPGASLTFQEKLLVAQQLAAMNVDIIEGITIRKTGLGQIGGPGTLDVRVLEP